MLMLFGRCEERGLVAGLLAEARTGRSGALVVRGEAGIGKSALLADAAERPGDLRVLRAAGAGTEAELASAGLQQLLRPVLDRLGRLPAPQADALRGAFGLVDAEASRFLVELGVLSLLAEVAEERPLLCLVDNAQWLDRASAEALVFVARRLHAEPIVLLLAARDDDVRQFEAPGVPSLRLGGLDAEAAGQLLEARVDRLAPAVRARLISETMGNPLALLELPATLSSRQLAGSEPLPTQLPMTARLQQAFLQRVRRLPAATQALLLVAAAEDVGELSAILEAGRGLAIEPVALEPAEHAGLVRTDGQELRFRHPLVRSATYQGATFTARRAVHRALVQVLADDRHADRRAWHRAAATVGQDEEVARALEATGDRARRRGGPAAAAAALERAAELTPRPAPRARRLVAAAECLSAAGRGKLSLTLLDRSEPSAADPARMARVRGQVELEAGIPAVACTLLLEGARPVLGSAPELATEMLVLATWAALAANQLDRIVEEIGPAIAGLPGHDDVRIGRAADSLFAFGLGGPPPAGGARELPRRPRRAAAWPHPAFVWMWPMLVAAEPAGQDLTAGHGYARLVAARRAAGTVSTLTVALVNLALAESVQGLWPEATANATEGLRLARETGQPATAGYFLAMLAWIAAYQGRAENCRRLADEALAVASPRRLAVVAAFASWTLALLDLTEGRPMGAMERLRAVASPQHPTAHATIALLATGPWSRRRPGPAPWTAWSRTSPDSSGGRPGTGGPGPR
jgi:hypothetical protein